MTKEPNIIIVNDDEDDNQILKEVLETLSDDIIVSFYKDGFDLLADAGEIQIPDLIFLDIVMPKMSGIDCLKRVKRNTLLKDVPIIIYTGVHNVEVAKECFESGADVFIEKSLTYAGTRKLIERVLTIWTNAAISSQQHVLVEVDE